MSRGSGMNNGLRLRMFPIGSLPCQRLLMGLDCQILLFYKRPLPDKLTFGLSDIVTMVTWITIW